MSGVNGIARALSTATLQVQEIRAIARLWKGYSEFIIPRSNTLFAVLDKTGKAGLSAILNDSSTDSSALYRGLIIQLNSMFEGFIKLLVGAVVDEKCKGVIYDGLHEKLRAEHLVVSAKVLTHFKSGNVNGIRHDFTQTQTNLISCLTGEPKYSLNKDAFTLLMGNCTPERLETLFDNIGAGNPFGDELGENKKLQAWMGETSKRRVAKGARDELGRQLDSRNDLAHGNVARSITQTDFDLAADFFTGLVEGLSDIAGKNI